MKKPLKNKFYTKFSDETIQEALDNHEIGYKSIEEAVGDTNTFSKDTDYVILNDKLEIIWERKTKNNKGFGLIETMMALGLMSLGFLAFGQIMTNMALSQNWSDFRLSTNALASSMIGSLNNPATCTQGFTGMSFVPTGNPVPVSFSLPNKTLSAGTVVPNYNLSITTLSYINYRPVQTNLDGSVTYFGDLSMTTKASKRVLGPNTSTVTVDSIYMTVLGGLIINCGNNSPVPNPTPVPSPSPTPEATPMPSPVPTYTYTPPGEHDHDEPCDHDGR